jgi:RNA polymerase sporulation-specific sigma factor
LNDLDKKSDEELIILHKSGASPAEEELISRYTPYVRFLARPYFLAGGDAEDLIQEGMIGLLKAIREFDSRRDATFKTFAAACIRNKLYTALKNAARNKHSPLNNYISLEAPFFDRARSDTAISHLGIAGDPVDLVIGIENFKELSQALRGLLSGFEAKILALYLEGLSYQEISDATSKPQKSVDNAVQRIRRKLARYCLEHGNNR